jgi:hypothetical protein
VDILDSVIHLWAFSHPEAAYQAGLKEAAGLFFQKTEDSLAHVHKTAAEIEASIDKVADDNLRATALCLTRSIRSRVEDSRPYDVIGAAADGLHVFLFKGELDNQIIINYLQQVSDALKLDVTQWENVRLSAESKRHLYSKHQYLLKMLHALIRRDAPAGQAELLLAVESLSPLLIPYKHFYREDGIETSDVDELISFLKERDNPPSMLPGYRALLKDRYDFSLEPEQIHRLALSWLDEELSRLDQLVKAFAARYSVQNEFESIYHEICIRNKIEKDVIAVASNVSNALNTYTAIRWLDLAPEDCVEIVATPEYLEELTTEGMVESFDDLTDQPHERCYLTRSKNESYLTLLNVLVHEFAHAFQNLLTFRHSGHPLLKISSDIKAPLMEGIGFHREWELYEEANGLLSQPKLHTEEEQLLSLFGLTRDEQVKRIEEFEFETRLWRIARFLRVLCDVNVHLGLQTYSGFLNWANARTGFSKRRIHQYCFNFLRNPGYANCYAVPGMMLAGIQEKVQNHGYSRKEFNTSASSMGFYPWTIFEQHIHQKFYLTQ